jgi:hypothetical protein
MLAFEQLHFQLRRRPEANETGGLSSQSAQMRSSCSKNPGGRAPLHDSA